MCLIVVFHCMMIEFTLVADSCVPVYLLGIPGHLCISGLACSILFLNATEHSGVDFMVSPTSIDFVTRQGSEVRLI